MGLFDIFKKKKLDKKNLKPKMTPQQVADAVSAITKIRNAQNDEDFIQGMTDLPANKKKKLTFKSVDACFEYMEKFFTNDELLSNSLYHGKILYMIVNDAGKKTLAYVKVLCLIYGKTDYAMVSGFLCDCEDMWKCKCKTKLKIGDMVYVGMGTVINKTIDNTVRRWEEKFKTEEDFKGDKWHKNNYGTIIKKLKLTLNVATSQFDHED